MVHKRISWNRGSISKSGPKFRPKIVKNWIFNEKVHRIRKTSSEPFFTFSQDITMLKKWFISAFPEIQKISQNLGPNLGQKLNKNWIFNEKVHRIRENLTEPFSAFSKDITMLKKWFISALAEIEKISQNLGPKLGQKLNKNEYFNGKVHRIRETSQNRFFPFSKDIPMLKKWFISTFAESPENISKSGPKVRPKIVKNWIFNEKVHRIRKPSQNRFRFF